MPANTRPVRVRLAVASLAVVILLVLTPAIGATQAPSEPDADEVLALGMRAGSTTTSLVSYDVVGDLWGVMYLGDLSRVEAQLSSVPAHTRMMMTPTLDGVEEALSRLSIEIAYLGYDLERWDQTPIWEQENPVEAVKLMRQIADAHGLKLVIGPSRYFNENFAAQMAPYVHAYIPQAKAYQANLSLDDYRDKVRGIMTQIKQANPAARVYLDLSPSPKGVPKTAEEMMACVDAVRDLIDGVWVTQTAEDAATLAEFVALLGRSDAPPAVTPTPNTPRPPAVGPTPAPSVRIMLPLVTSGR
ncbi:MAG: hypothetical protein HPY83_19490 [Anaerolineae bacterium]|nr:hypothetical protein [Anaerolineae bacterium]